MFHILPKHRHSIIYSTISELIIHFFLLKFHILSTYSIKLLIFFSCQFRKSTKILYSANRLTTFQVHSVSPIHASPIPLPSDASVIVGGMHAVSGPVSKICAILRFFFFWSSIESPGENPSTSINQCPSSQRDKVNSSKFFSLGGALV